MVEILLKTTNVTLVQGGIVQHAIIQNKVLDTDEYSTKQMIEDIMIIDSRARLLFNTIISKYGIIDVREGSYVDKFLDTYDAPGVAQYQLLLNEITSSKVYTPLQ